MLKPIKFELNQWSTDVFFNFRLKFVCLWQICFTRNIWDFWSGHPLPHAHSSGMVVVYWLFSYVVDKKKSMKLSRCLRAQRWSPYRADGASCVICGASLPLGISSLNPGQPLSGWRFLCLPPRHVLFAPLAQTRCRGLEDVFSGFVLWQAMPAVDLPHQVSGWGASRTPSTGSFLSMMAMFRSFVSAGAQLRQQQHFGGGGGGSGPLGAPGDSIESQFSCPICLEVYHKPVSVAGCGHT